MRLYDFPSKLKDKTLEQGKINTEEEKLILLERPAEMLVLRTPAKKSTEEVHAWPWEQAIDTEFSFPCCKSFMIHSHF